MKDYELQQKPAQQETQLALVDSAERQAIKENRAEMINAALAPAYASVGQINITPEESTKLMAPFADAAVRSGAKGDERLLYIPHIHLSDRLNQVLGIGQWSLVRRGEKLGEIITGPTGKKTQRVYADCVLVIRGAVASEAVGSGAYHPNNPKEDYSSGVEQAVSDGLSRCCKRLSIGSQVWDPAHNEAWLERQSEAKTRASASRSDAVTERRQAPVTPAQKPPADSTTELHSAIQFIDRTAKSLGIDDGLLAEAIARAIKAPLILDDWRDYPPAELIRASKTRAWNSLLAICDDIAREKTAAASAPETEEESLFGEP